MNFVARRRMKNMLEDCDYQLACEIIKQKFGSQDAQYESSQGIEDYISNPCFKTAVKLIETDPLFTYYFVESKPGGLYTRINGKADKKPALKNISDKPQVKADIHKEVDEVREQVAASVPSNPQEEGRAEARLMTTEFSNVISTLQHDIKQLQDQVKVFERHMLGYPENHVEVKKYEKLAAVYKEGLAEFNEAVKILQAHSKQRRS